MLDPALWCGSWICRHIGWLKPDGVLKDMMAHVTMLAMHNDGVIALPPPRGRRYRPRPIAFGPDTEPPLFPQRRASTRCARWTCASS